MNCEQLHALIEAGDAMPSPDARARGDAHLASCAECSAAWDAYRRWAALEVPQTPSHLRTRIAAAVDGAARRGATRRGKLRAPLLTAGFACVGAALAAAVAYVNSSPKTGPALVESFGGPSAPALPSDSGPPALVSSQSQPRASTSTGWSLEAQADIEGGDDLPPSSVDFNTVLVLAHSSPGDARLDALLDDVESALTRIAGLNVLGFDYALPLIEAGIPEERFAAILGAGHVLTIALQRAPSDFVDAVLLDGRTGEVLAGSAGGSAMPPEGDIDWRDRAEAIARLVHEHVDPAARERADGSKLADVLNTALTELERVAALARLGRSFENGRVVLPEPAIIAAADMAAGSTDSDTKRGVWMLLKGTGHPYLLEPLIQSLFVESDPAVRATAADALEDFVQEPRVREALVRARDTDVSEDVRAEAAASLMTDDERRTRALQTFADVSLPTPERERAMTDYARRTSPPLEDGIVGAMVDFVKESGRTSAWQSLGSLRNPQFVPPLLDALRDDADRDARASAVYGLGFHVDRPEVRAALENVRDTDPEWSVRRAAATMLR